MSGQRNKPDIERRRRLEEAALWVVQLDESEYSAERHTEWARWLDEKPENSATFDQILTLCGQIEEHKGELIEIPVPEGPSASSSGSRPARYNNQSMRRTSNLSIKSWTALALAASVASMVVLLSHPILDNSAGKRETNRALRYETPQSVHRSVELEDGSRIDIGAYSALTLDYSPQRRTVILDRGEALFSVKKDPDRPFVVIAGRGRITALGTAFNVRRDSDRVVVTVTEGTVEVEPQRASPEPITHSEHSASRRQPKDSARLAVGEQLVLDSSGLSGIAVTDPAIATSWKEGRLQYLREPLSAVISGVNRYSDLKIIIADSELNDLLFTGTIFSGQSRDWLEGVSTVLPVQVEYVGNRTALLKARDASHEE